MCRKTIYLFLLILSFLNAQSHSFSMPLNILYPKPNEIILIEPPHTLGLAQQKQHALKRAFHALSQQCAELIGFNAQENPKITQKQNNILFEGTNTTIKALVIKAENKKDTKEFVLHLKMLSCDTHKVNREQ